MKNNPKVVVSDHPFEDLEVEHRILETLSADIVDCNRKNLSFSEEAPTSDAILTTYASINEDIISRLEKCKIIARYGIGVDNVDIEAATKKGIYVTNVPDYCIDEVSNHALALILASLRKIFPYSCSVESGEWNVNVGKPIPRMRNLNLGLVGFGKIARKLATKGESVGFNVLANDPYLSEKEIKDLGARPVDFSELLKKSDVISIHIPLTEETKHMFSDDEFDKMKPNTLLINTARGSIVDTKSLVRALDEGKIRAAALDVLDEEPPKRDSPLLKRNDILLTPHAAWYSEGSLIELREKATAKVLQALKGRPPRNLVNDEILE